MIVRHRAIVARCTEREIRVFFLMIRRPPRSTLDRSSAASDVYKRQLYAFVPGTLWALGLAAFPDGQQTSWHILFHNMHSVSYTHLRAHETVLDLVCRLLLEKKKTIYITLAR